MRDGGCKSRTSAKMAQYVPRCLPLYAAASSPGVSWRPCRIGSLSQGSYRVGSSGCNPARRKRASCGSAPRCRARCWCAKSWRPSACWSRAHTSGLVGGCRGLHGRVVVGCRLQVAPRGKALRFARRLGHGKRGMREARWVPRRVLMGVRETRRLPR